VKKGMAVRNKIESIFGCKGAKKTAVVVGKLTTVRNTLSNIVFLGSVLLIVGLMLHKVKVVYPDSVLVVQPKGVLTEQLSLDSSSVNVNQEKVWQYVAMLNNAARDERIKAVMLRLDEVEASPIVALDLFRSALEKFEKSGKPVYAFSNSYSQTAYYIATAANKIYMNPMGVVQIKGLGAYHAYYGDAAKWAGIKIVAFKAGKYKSAVEPYIRGDMSEATKVSYRPVLGDIWGRMLSNMSAARPFGKKQLNAMLHAGNYSGIIDSGSAVKEKIIDVAAPFVVLEDKLASDYASNDATLSFRAIQDVDYLSAEGISGIDDVVSGVDGGGSVLADDHNVAVIVLNGTIAPGEKAPGQIGSLSAVKLLRQARLSLDVIAVVLRIDSPGGSAIASDRIRDEILKLRQAGKPVVISMGSLCASGGYWMASAGNYLFAQKDTVTGSIGVFGLYASLSDLMGRAHVHVDGVGTTVASSVGRIDMPMNPRFNHAMQANVNRIYQQFLALVKEGRGKRVGEDVDALAQGRIWDASQALHNGLIDKIGGLDDAIKKAADIAGVKSFGIKVIAQQISLSDRLRWQIEKQINGRATGILTQIESKINELKSQSGKVMALSPKIRSDGVYGL